MVATVVHRPAKTSAAVPALPRLAATGPTLWPGRPCAPLERAEWRVACATSKPRTRQSPAGRRRQPSKCQQTKELAAACGAWQHGRQHAPCAHLHHHTHTHTCSTWQHWMYSVRFFSKQRFLLVMPLPSLDKSVVHVVFVGVLLPFFDHYSHPMNIAKFAGECRVCGDCTVVHVRGRTGTRGRVVGRGIRATM